MDTTICEDAMKATAEDQGEAMVGRLIGRYEVLCEIGAGGMGKVYLTQDNELSRKVALKLLPPRFTSDRDQVHRFQQEARAASALNHPNILTVYDIGQAGDCHYIATEFIDGVTLRQRMADTRMRLGEVLDVAIQVASALAAAHAAGIVHRDIKPENIMVRPDGYVKVLDFGLAKLTEQTEQHASDPEARTRMLVKTNPGMVMGTVSYMSPEQVRGLKVDARTDSFSLGVVLYEMVTGHVPFAGPTTSDVIAAILDREPPPLAQYATGIPAELERIISKALEKDREMRYQSVADLRVDLVRLRRDIDSGRVTALTAIGSGKEQLAIGDIVESRLSDSDPRVLRATRFSKASVALAVFGILGVIAAWVLYNRSVAAEFKLDVPKVAALSKAREIVASFGYNTIGLNERIRFRRTDFDLKHVATKYGLDEARRAVREGKVAAWEVAFTQGNDFSWFYDKLKPGEFSVSINPSGKLFSFVTLPSENAGSAELEREQALEIAGDVVRRTFSIDPSGYEIEFVKRSSPPGVVEISWQNRNLVFDHREVVRVELQGSKVTKLNRSFEPLQVLSEAGRNKSGFVDIVTRIQRVIVILAEIAIYVFGLVFLIIGKRWEALRRRLPIAASVMIAGSFGMLVVVGIDSSSESGFQEVIIMIQIMGAMIFGVASFPFLAGIFEWLRVLSPARLYGAEQLVKGRVFSRPVAASLVHGALGGALVMGISKSLEGLMAIIPGYSPSTPEIMEKIFTESSFALALFNSLLGSALLILIVVPIVELTERMARRQILITLIPALLIAAMTSKFTQANFLAVVISFLSTFLATAVMVQFYRSRGLAAACLVSAVSILLDVAVASRFAGDSSLVFQSNMILLIVVLLLAVGVWGYAGTRLMRSLSTADLKAAGRG